MARWIPLTTASEMAPDSARELVADDRIVALFRVGDAFHALDGICPHQGGPLGKGRLTGDVITCPWHGWQFQVTTGQHRTNATICHPRFPVKVEDGIVYVDVDPAPAPQADPHS